MTVFEPALPVANAILYEGYLLFPYTASSRKNRVRWQFGVVVPRAYLAAGTGDAHRFLNQTDKNVLLLVVGDRSANDDVRYPDVDMHLAWQPDGSRRFFHKNGTPY